MSRKIKIAVIGVGYLGNYHTEKYAKLPDVELVAVVDTNRDRAKAIADRYQTKFYTNYRDVLDQVQAVSIVVPTEYHYAVTQQCLEAGLDVLVEKPMTKKVWQAEKLLALAKNKKTILQVGHLERFNSAIEHAKTILTKPLFIECHRLNSFVERGTDVDVVLDLMIHDLDIILSLVPSPVLKIDAVGTPVLSGNIDIANVRLRFQNGCVVNLTASRISFNPMRKMRIFQPDAYVSLDFNKANVEIYRTVSDDTYSLPQIKGEQLSLQKKDALEEEIRAFVDAVKKRDDLYSSAERALKALKLADQVVREIKKTARKYYPKLTENLPAFQA